MTRTGALFGAICGALIAALTIFDPTLFGAEWLLHDRITRILAKRRTPDPRVVLAVINEETTKNLDAVGYGRPPYTRDVHAIAVRELQRAGAKVIAFDIAFPEEDLNHPEADRELAATVAQSPSVAGVLTLEKLTTDHSTYATKLWRIRGAAPPAVGVRLPFFDAPAIGTISLADADKRSPVTRNYKVGDHVGGGSYVPSLALEAARTYLALPRDGTWTPSTFTFSGRRVPIRTDKTFAIRWKDYQPQQISYDKIVSAGLMRDEGTEVPELKEFEEKFRGKIVLIGYTAQGLLDLRSTPLHEHAAGMFIHANAIDNVLNGQFNEQANPYVFALLIIVVATLFGGFLYGIGKQLGAGALAIVIVGGWAAAGFVALNSSLIIPAVSGASSILLTYIVITVNKFMAEQRHSGMLRTTFGRYVSPQILEHVLAHPEKVELGGERRDLTILFSDIRGFTSISEASEPEQVVEMLNEYLTRMVEILLAHGGTLDKFIGDAVMGFWNAPAPDPDHPRHAVACALEMIEETARIRERWETQGKASIRIGIGVNTGDAVVGNIGAEKVFGYTVIGDAVNLASRLEGKNKDYGTEIIISEFTLARIGNEFETVYLDEVKVKGKERAVRIYEVKGKSHA